MLLAWQWQNWPAYSSSSGTSRPGEKRQPRMILTPKHRGDVPSSRNRAHAWRDGTSLLHFHAYTMQPMPETLSSSTELRSSKWTKSDALRSKF